MSERIARLEQEAANLKVRNSAKRDGILQAVGALMMVGGVVVAFVAYQLSLDKADDRDIESLIILAISMLGVSVVGAAVFLRYSLARFLRFWLLRQLYEGQAHVDRLVRQRSASPAAPRSTRSPGREASRGRRRLSRSAPRGPPSRPARHCPLRNPDKPAVYLGDQVLTAAQVADEVSRYVQALESKGLGRGSPAAVLALNRPEVLFNMGASMLVGCRTTPLHPLGSLDDHAYVLEDAGVETLVFDPEFFGERAAELATRVPGLKNLLALGPSEVGDDYIALASTFEPRPLLAPRADGPDIPGLAYTGGTTGKPKGVMGSYRSGAAMSQIMLTEWEWARAPVPHVHAAEPCRGRVLHSGPAVGRVARRGAVLRAGAGAGDHRA